MNSFCDMKSRPARPRPAPRKPAPGKRLENKQKTRKAILSAALDLFARKGFYRTTTKAISERAGIAEGTLFNYFATKEDLALYFFEQELDGLTAWFDGEARLAAAPLPERLFAIIQRHLERIARHEEFIGAVYLWALAARLQAQSAEFAVPGAQPSLPAVHPPGAGPAEQDGDIPEGGGPGSIRLRPLPLGHHHLLAARPFAGERGDAGPAGPMLETGHPRSAQGRMGMVKPAQGPVSFLGRGFRLGKLGLSVTGSYLGYQAQNLFLSEEAGRGQRRRFEQTASRRLRQELELLKGPAMKLGQILSMHTQMLPESALRELASLQMQAPPMHPTLARRSSRLSAANFLKRSSAISRPTLSPRPRSARCIGPSHAAAKRSPSSSNTPPFAPPSKTISSCCARSPCRDG